MNSHVSWFSFLTMLTSSTTAFVPHSFWGRGRGLKRTSMCRTKCGLSMYFDDCERRDDEQFEPWLNTNSLMSSQTTPSNWRLPFGEEKRLALERYLGYNQESASALSIDEIEEATLIWAVDCNIVALGNDESIEQEVRCKYTSISDLLIASACSTVTDCLAFVWDTIVKLYETGSSSKDGESVQIIAFPTALWDYETMVTMLNALEICKPLLPSDKRLKIDLFHPDYKHAPKMLSPHAHSPFPTVGIQMLSVVDAKEEMDSDERTRDKLRNLFDSVDAAVPTVSGSNSKQDITARGVKLACQNWADAEAHIPKGDSGTWKVVMQKDPYQMYKSVWMEIQKLASSSSFSLSFVIAPHLDAHTTHRLAVTVNAALRRFESRIRISHVYHPDGQKHLYAPHPTIQIERQAK